MIHPDDVARVRAALEAGAQGAPIDIEVRLTVPGRAVGARARASSSATATASPSACAAACRTSPPSARPSRRWRPPPPSARRAALERRIADELQHSLLPAVTFDPDQLEVATFYQPGVAGTQVGGDWYDVIEVGAGRTALVIGDVMGRGVNAAAVMGQLRTAVRAYARLDLPPADILEYLDASCATSARSRSSPASTRSSIPTTAR